MFAVMAIALVLGQSPVVTPPAGQQPIDFPAPGEPLRVEGGAIAWQGSSYWVTWTDRRRAFDVSTAPVDVWVAQWNEGTRMLSQVALRGGASFVSDLKLAVSRGDTRLYSVRVDDGGVQVVIDSLLGAAAGGLIPATSQAVNGIAVAAVENEFLLAIRGNGTLRLIREGPAELVTTSLNVSDVRVTGVDGGFLVSFIDMAGPRVAMVPLGSMMSSRSAQPISFMPSPSLLAPVPTEPPSFITSDTTLRYAVMDAGQLVSFPLLPVPSQRLLVGTAPDSGFAVVVNGTGVLTVPMGVPAPQTLLFDAGTPLGLSLHDLSGAAFVSYGGAGAIHSLSFSQSGQPALGPLFELKSRAPQRAPTAIWSSAANLFLVAWEQRSAAGFEARLRGIDRAGNASVTQPISAVPLAGGLDPRLLEAPDGGGVAIQLRVSTDAGLQTAISLVNPTTLALGSTFGAFSAQDRVLYHPVSVVWAQTNPTAVSGMGTLPFPAPRCVAGAGGRAWFSGIGNNQLVVSTVPSGGSIIVTPPGPLADAPGCAAVGRNGTVMVAARAGPSIHLAHVDTGVLLIDQRNLQTLVTGDPVVTALGDGFLVAWPSGTNILAFEVKSPPITWVPITIGPVMGEVRDLAATSAPSGEALLMWHAFDAQRGHSVWARVVSVPGFDGGIGLDGGFGVVDAGFGVVDAGLAGDGGVVAEDGGVVVADGGVVAEDAGVVVVDGGVVAEDGGVVIVDAGAAVDGGPGEVELVPVCGCSAVDPRLVALLALVALTRRRGREAARDVFR